MKEWSAHKLTLPIVWNYLAENGKCLGWREGESAFQWVSYEDVSKSTNYIVSKNDEIFFSSLESEWGSSDTDNAGWRTKINLKKTKINILSENGGVTKNCCNRTEIFCLWLFQVLSRAKHVGSGLLHLGMKATNTTRIGMYSQNRVEVKNRSLFRPRGRNGSPWAKNVSLWKTLLPHTHFRSGPCLRAKPPQSPVPPPRNNLLHDPAAFTLTKRACFSGEEGMITSYALLLAVVELEDTSCGFTGKNGRVYVCVLFSVHRNRAGVLHLFHGHRSSVRHSGSRRLFVHHKPRWASHEFGARSCHLQHWHSSRSLSSLQIEIMLALKLAFCTLKLDSWTKKRMNPLRNLRSQSGLSVHYPFDQNLFHQSALVYDLKGLPILVCATSR